jgi:hypothetical protein
MRCLTVLQPWATLIAIGAKRIETRSWPTNYRGPLAIHAGKNKQYFNELGLNIAYGEEGVLFVTGLPYGCIVATCELAGCQLVERSDIYLLGNQEKRFGDYSIGRYMWFLDDVKILPEPIPAKGAMGLWEWNSDELTLTTRKAA